MGSRHHLCLFNHHPPLRTSPRPSVTSRLLSQDPIFDSFREVCTSRKTPPDLSKKKRHRKKQRAGQHMYTHIHNRHTCVGVYQSSQRNRDVLAEQTRDCLCSEVAVSSFERFKDFFFLCCRNDFGGRQTSELNHRRL